MEVRAVNDGHRFRFVVERDGERRDLFVEISGTAYLSAESLPSPLDDDASTDGLHAAQRYIDEANESDGEPPVTIEVSTTRVVPTFPETPGSL